MSQSGRDIWDWTITAVILVVLAWAGVLILAIYSNRARADITLDLYGACVGGPAEDSAETQDHLRSCLQFRFPDWSIIGPESRTVPYLPYLIRELNQVRAKGLRCGGPTTPVAWSWGLTEEAAKQAKYLADTHQLTHVGPDGSQAWERGRRRGYQWCLENAGVGTTDADRIIRAWEGSTAGHCEALVDPKAEVFGAAEVGGYWVLMLCAKDWPE